MKAATLESKFPLLAVENGCIVSKEADVTVAFRVELPELFSVTGSEYEAVHSAWHKAVKVLPEYSIVHKQDFFIEEKYRPETDRDDLSFLSRSFERHFNERPFLNHFCSLPRRRRHGAVRKARSPPSARAGLSPRRSRTGRRLRGSSKRSVSSRRS